jgi:hypothetical protein
LPLNRDSLGDHNVSRPTKGAGWQRDRVTVHCLRIVNGLNVCHRTIGIVDGGAGVRSEKTAPKQSAKNGCNSFHQCGLSFLAMRWRRFRYQCEPQQQFRIPVPRSRMHLGYQAFFLINLQ